MDPIQDMLNPFSIILLLIFVVFLFFIYKEVISWYFQLPKFFELLEKQNRLLERLADKIAPEPEQENREDSSPEDEKEP